MFNSGIIGAYAAPADGFGVSHLHCFIFVVRHWRMHLFQLLLPNNSQRYTARLLPIYYLPTALSLRQHLWHPGAIVQLVDAKHGQYVELCHPVIGLFHSVQQSLGHNHRLWIAAKRSRDNDEAYYSSASIKPHLRRDRHVLRRRALRLRGNDFLACRPSG